MDVARVKYTMLRNEATDVLSVNQASYDNKYTMLRNEATNVLFVNQTSYDNKYTLNVEQSLRKKLESTNRTVIEYSFAGGGVTVKYDTVTLNFLYMLVKSTSVIMPTKN